jgi:hypothetical protein
MTFAFQSPRHIDGIGTVFYGPEQVYDVDSAAAGYLHNFDIGGIV